MKTTKYTMPRFPAGEAPSIANPIFAKLPTAPVATTKCQYQGGSGVCLQWGSALLPTPSPRPPVNRMTDASETITFPRDR